MATLPLKSPRKEQRSVRPVLQDTGHVKGQLTRKWLPLVNIHEIIDVLII